MLPVALLLLAAAAPGFRLEGAPVQGALVRGVAPAGKAMKVRVWSIRLILHFSPIPNLRPILSCSTS